MSQPKVNSVAAETMSSFFSGQKILITGASGFIGPHLCRRLCGTGAEVHTVSRTLHTTAISNLHCWQGDLADIETVRDLCDKVKPEVIFHLAGHAAGARNLELVLPTFHSNLATTVNVLTVATEVGCRRIVLPGSLEEPEQTTAVPSSPYAASKWASSAYGRMFHALYQAPVVIARVFITYGPGDKPTKLIPYVIRSLLQGEAPKLSGGQRQVDWVYVDDVVDGLLAAAHAPAVEGCTIDVGSGNLVTIRSIVDRLVGLIDPQIEPLFGAIADRPFEQVRVADTAKSGSLMGWQPVTPLEEGLERTVDWYRRQLRTSSG